MGYSFESYCTVPSSGDDELPRDAPDGWSGDVNTNVQVGMLTSVKTTTVDDSGASRSKVHPLYTGQILIPASLGRE